MNETAYIQKTMYKCNSSGSLLNILTKSKKVCEERSKWNNKSWSPTSFMGSHKKVNATRRASFGSGALGTPLLENNCKNADNTKVRRKSVTVRKPLTKSVRYGKSSCRRYSREEKKNIYNMLISRLVDSSGSSMLMVMGNGSGGSGSNSPSNGNPGPGQNGLHHQQQQQPSPDSTIPTVTINRNVSGGVLPPEANNRQSLKHLSVSAPAMRSSVNRGNTVGDSAFNPSSSKSRQKKFHRHFKQVSPDEKVLDYYSCALVADILLQGYLYVTENHFAFYSNVFGYVKKVLIPVGSVVEISKERTAKIIPNAVGVRTNSDKHVFASLLSRDTTYKLMQKVWNHSELQEAQEEATTTGSATDVLPDESSGDSGSGNDSAIEQLSCTPSPLNTPSVEKIIKIGKLNSANTNSIAQVVAAGSTNLTATITTTSPSLSLSTKQTQGYQAPHRTSVVANSPPNLSSFTSKASLNSSGGASGSRGPSLLVLATALLVILFFSAALLLSRISNLQQRLAERPALRDSEQFYQELLTWQNKLHSSSADEIHQYINSNLQQIIKVRESLEALSLLFMNRPDSAIIREQSSSSIGNKDS